MAPLQLLLLAGAVAAATAAIEATLYTFTSGVDAHRILLAHFDLDMEVRPAWWVLAAGSPSRLPDPGDTNLRVSARARAGFRPARSPVLPKSNPEVDGETK